MNKSFSTTVHRASKSIASSPSPVNIPTNGNRSAPNTSRPAPLKTGGCASCGKKR